MFQSRLVPSVQSVRKVEPIAPTQSISKNPPEKNQDERQKDIQALKEAYENLEKENEKIANSSAFSALKQRLHLNAEIIKAAIEKAKKALK